MEVKNMLQPMQQKISLIFYVALLQKDVIKRINKTPQKTTYTVAQKDVIKWINKTDKMKTTYTVAQNAAS